MTANNETNTPGFTPAGNESDISFIPIVQVELPTVSGDAFRDAMLRFNARALALAEEGALPPMPFIADGWVTITPAMAEAALLHSGGNRELALAVIRAYAIDMANNNWAATGETIVIVAGKLRNGHHRLMACYLGGVPFVCYIIVSAPVVENIFAYYDSGKKRNAADALHIAGLNGSSKIVASAVQSFAFRYDANLLGVVRHPPGFRGQSDNRTVMHYVETHRDLLDAAHLMLGTYPMAVDVIYKKPVAVFFAWLVLREGWDRSTLHDFCQPLGTGANLDEDSPILALRAVLLAPVQPGATKMKDTQRLAYINKAFMMFVNDQRMPRVRGRVQPLEIDTQAPMPRIAAPDPVTAAAAE